MATRHAETMTNGVNEVQRITFGGTPTGGSFKLRFRGKLTASINWSATNNTLRDNVDAALEALSTIGADNVTVAVGTMTAGIGFLTATFGGDLAKKSLPLMTAPVNALTGTSPTVAVTETTPGVDATRRDAAQYDVLITEDGGLYQNTAADPPATWVAIPLAQSAHIADPSGAVTDQDDEARAKIVLILNALEAAGIVAAA